MQTIGKMLYESNGKKGGEVIWILTWGPSFPFLSPPHGISIIIRDPPAHFRFDSLWSLCQWVYTSSCTEISRMYPSPIAAALRYHDYRSIISYHGGSSIMKYIRYMESLFPLSAHTCTQHNDTAPDIKTLPHPLRPRTYLRSQVIHKTSNENNPTWAQRPPKTLLIPPILRHSVIIDIISLTRKRKLCDVQLWRVSELWI